MAERAKLPAGLLDPTAKLVSSRTIAVEPDPVMSIDDEADTLTLFRERGRPTEYFPRLDKMVTRMLMLGITVARICEIIGISEATFFRWHEEHPSFRDAVFQGREGSDARVVASLFHRAVGYSHRSEKIWIGKDGDGNIVEHRAELIEHFPPDVGAAQFWLTNRTNNAARLGQKRVQWKNRITEEQEDGEGNVVDPSKPPTFIIQAVAAPKKDGGE